MEEFQEADILWPETAPSRHELYEAAFFSFESFDEPAALAISVSCTSLFDRSEGFLSGEPSTVASQIAAAEEFQEADVLWPDTVDERREGGNFRWLWCDGGGVDGHVKLEGWRPVSSPIDIPAKVIDRCRSTVPLNGW